jgi:copine 5/8/9
MDFIGKSDPYCKVYLKNDERSPWVMISRTETVRESLSPEFSTPITIDYYFEKNQEIRFEIWDEDPGDDDEEGSHSTTVGKLVGAKKQTYIAALSHSKKQGDFGSIIVKSDTIKESNQFVSMEIKAHGLKSKKYMMGMLSSNHPFLVIKK